MPRKKASPFMTAEIVASQSAVKVFHRYQEQVLLEVSLVPGTTEASLPPPLSLMG